MGTWSNLAQGILRQIRVRGSELRQSNFVPFKNIPSKSPTALFAGLVDDVSDLVAGRPEKRKTHNDHRGVAYEDTQKTEKDESKKKKYKAPEKEESDLFQFSVKTLLSFRGAWTFAKYKEYQSASVQLI